MTMVGRSIVVTMALLAPLLSGCLMWGRPLAKADTSDDFPLDRRMQAISSLKPVAWYGLQPGTYCCLETVFDPRGATDLSIERSKVAGRVVFVDESTVVLDDAISIDDRMTKVYGNPVMSKVPYVSRLYQNSRGITVPTSLPGELKIARSSVVGASTIDAGHWPTFRRDGMERIGIDFDFNVE
jgi:hypothetical protein